MKKPKYFDSKGTQLEERDALDGEGRLKDGCRIQVPMWMADAARAGSYPNGGGSRSSAPRGSREGDACTIDGAPGRLRRGSDGELVCVPTRSTDAAVIDSRMHRPGYRIPEVVDRQPLRDAYASYQTRIQNAWKAKDGQTTCPDCDGEGYDDDGGTCETCGGDGVVDDNTTDAQCRIHHFFTPQGDAATHKERMSQLYDAYDQQLSNAWRTGK